MVDLLSSLTYIAQQDLKSFSKKEKCKTKQNYKRGSRTWTFPVGLPLLISQDDGCSFS